MKTYRFNKYHPNVDLDRLKYDSFRINTEIQWINVGCLLESLFILYDLPDEEDIKDYLVLPLFIYFITRPNNLSVYKMRSFKCM